MEDGLPPEPTIEDGIIRLRPWEPKDLPCVKAASDEGVIPDGTTVPRQFSEEAGREWIARQRSQVQGGQGWSCAISTIPEDKAVGCVVLLLQHEGVGRIGYWLVPEARGNGYATRAVSLLTDWALHDPGLARVEAG